MKTWTQNIELRDLIMICTDLKPIQMSPACNLIFNTTAKIRKLKGRSTEDGVAGLMEKEMGVVSSWKPLK